MRILHALHSAVFRYRRSGTGSNKSFFRSEDETNLILYAGHVIAILLSFYPLLSLNIYSHPGYSEHHLNLWDDFGLELNDFEIAATYSSHAFS